MRNLEPIALTPLVTRVVEVVRTLDIARGITIRVDADAQGGTVLGDMGSLQETLTSALVDVLRQATPGAVVELSLSRDDVRAEIRVGLEGVSGQASAATLRLPPASWSPSCCGITAPQSMSPTARLTPWPPSRGRNTPCSSPTSRCRSTMGSG
jgi:hypothetical protein